MKIIAGVDCHKASHSVAFLDEAGRLVEELTIANSPEGFDEAMQCASRLGQSASWGLESVGSYGRAFAKYLVDRGRSVLDVPPAYTKRYRKHSTKRGKSDAIDARAIAEVVLRDADRLGRFFGEGAHDELRLYYDCRDRLVRDRSQALNRVRHAAFRLNITQLPKALHRPQALAKLRAQLDRIEVSTPVSQALVTELRFGVQAIEMLNEQITEVERILRPLVRHLTQLSELVGVSTVVAAGIAGHAGDLRNCRNADAFAMRSATAPVPCSSGQNQSLRVNTGGNRQLNRLLYVIAWNQLRRAGHPGRLYYDRKRTEGKSPRAAMRALKRRLATVVYLRLVADMRAVSRASERRYQAA